MPNMEKKKKTFLMAVAKNIISFFQTLPNLLILSLNLVNLDLSDKKLIFKIIIIIYF